MFNLQQLILPFRIYSLFLVITNTDMKTIDKYQFNEDFSAQQDGIQTFVANHIILKRPFTLKVANQGPQSQKDNYNYLIKEAQVLKKITHPNVYKCHKLLKSKNNFYVIFDSFQGENLEAKMKGNLSFDAKLMIAKQLIEAVLTISSLKMAYLTLNPSNVMVDVNNKVVLKNFGLAEEFQDKSEVIDLPMFMGKMTIYTPPELQNGKVYINSDQYSLGMLIEFLFERQFETNPKQNIKLRIKFDKQAINTDLTLDLLAELSSKLNIKNPRQRSRLVDAIKNYRKQTSQLLRNSPDNKLTSSKNQLMTPPGLVRQKSSLQVSMTKEESRLSRTKSTRSISDIGEKRQLNLTSVEDLVLVIVKKRNFVHLLLKMSQQCISNREVNLNTSLTLAFMLAKKATLEISQLTKFVKQGINREMSISSKFKEHFQKTEAYTQLCELTNKQMTTTQSYFQQLLSKVKLMPSFVKNQSLQSEVRYERLSSYYLRRTVLQFLLELQLLTTEKYANMYGKRTLSYLYVISLLSDFDNYTQMHDYLFTEGLGGFENEPLIQELMKMQGSKIVELIEINSNNLFSEENYKTPLAVKNTVTVK